MTPNFNYIKRLVKTVAIFMILFIGSILLASLFIYGIL